MNGIQNTNPIDLNVTKQILSQKYAMEMLKQNSQNDKKWTLIKGIKRFASKSFEYFWNREFCLQLLKDHCDIANNVYSNN